MKELRAEIDSSYIQSSLVMFDSIVFLVFLFIGLSALYIFRKKYKLGVNLTIFLLVYIIFSYSSYNLMVMPIHDFNIPVARNFIYHFKLISALSLSDVIILFAVFFILVACAVNYAWRPAAGTADARVNALVKTVAIQGGLVFIISIVGYMLYSSAGGVSSLKNEAMYLRGIMYFIALAFLFYRCIGEKNNVSFSALLLIFCSLDFINFLSGLIGTFIYTDYVWERYGVKVTIIDQDKIYNYFTLYVFILVSMYFSDRKRIGLTTGLIAIISVCMLLNVYKFLFAISALYLIYEIIVRIVSRTLPLKRFLLLLIIGGVLIHPAIKIFTSKPISTRASQLHDYWQYTGRFFPANVFGIGYGGLYYSPTGIADKGEIKKIDEDADGNIKYKRSIQTPLITQIKSSGILGLGVMLISAMFAFVRLFSLNVSLSRCSYITPICFNLIWMIGVVCIVAQPYPMPAITFIKLLILLGLAITQKKERETRPDAAAIE
ncbi:TPA: hypothetical protein R4186_000580 [Serratia marcescens]|nr:hypothetical protein [Serratia marcescens]HED3725824.1 hypothetical protein [Serratia marcescens]HED3793945.1 hypothetical protein [Serratia marcescens]